MIAVADADAVDVYVGGEGASWMLWMSDAASLWQRL